jgi:hypothetical protein
LANDLKTNEILREQKYENVLKLYKKILFWI